MTKMIGANFSGDTPWDGTIALYADEFPTSAASLGLATGLLLTAALGDTKHTVQYWQLVGALLALLLVLLLLVILYCYRQCVKVMLFLAHGSHYRGLMSGPDALWCIHDPLSRPIINVLATIRARSSVELMTDIGKCMERAVKDHPRLSCTRHTSVLGYSYWRRSQLSVTEHVRCLGDSQSNETLQQLVSRLSNTPLPMDDHSTWEVLVGDHALCGDEFPVLFRVHHSLGDGVTLVSLLLDTLSSQKQNRELLRSRSLQAEEENKGSALWEEKLRRLSDWNLLSSVDKNCLKSSQLLGEKVVAWYRETDEPVLFHAIKRIKKTVVGARFTDVVLTAVSASLEHHFKSHGCPVPDDIKVVIPVRVDGARDNGFSVGLLSLPIHAASPAERFHAVCTRSAALRSSGHYQLNWLLLKVMGTSLPLQLLGRALGGLPSTLVVSNVMGPTAPVSIQDHPLTSLVFFVPNRGDTGVGLSIMSYAGRLQLGLIADQALLASTSDVQRILDRVVVELSTLEEAMQYPHHR